MKTKTAKSDNITQAPRPRHIPQRTCIACRHTRGKREMVRLVCSGDHVEVDPRGKRPGRGVYICATVACWDAGLKSNRIEYGLRTKLSAENRQALMEFGASLQQKKVS